MPSNKPNDLYFAYMALTLIDGLSGSDRRVAGALLGHFNKKTGQCDPSIERLATMLGVDPSTVKRATGDLCGKHGLFVKTSHGGKSHRASYEPQWAKYNQIIADWNRRMGGGDPPSNSAELPCSGDADLFSNSAELHGKQRNIAPLNSAELRHKPYRRNLLKEPMGTSPVAPGAGEQSSGHVAGEAKRRLSEVVRGNLAKVDVRSQVVRQPSHFEASREAAKRRWSAKLLAMGGERYARVIGHITAEMAEEATDAEVKKHGAGLLLLWERLPREFSHA